MYLYGLTNIINDLMYLFIMILSLLYSSSRSIIDRTIQFAFLTGGLLLPLQTFSLAFLLSILAVAAVPADILAPANIVSHQVISNK